MNDNNRIYFLTKYSAYSIGYFETYAYTLLDNHTHWFIKCTDDSLLKKHLESLPAEVLKQHQKKYLDNKITFSEACEF